MRRNEWIGAFVPGPTLCSERRREYLQRAHGILGFYVAITAYCGKGKEVVEHSIEAHSINDDTTIKLTLDGHTWAGSCRLLRRMFGEAGSRLSNEVFLMLYGNLEAFLADLLADALRHQGAPDPLRAAVSMMMGTTWPGRLSRIQEKLGVRLGKGARVAHFHDVEMAFLGEASTDPAEFLENMAQLRHRLVHSTGRIDEEFAAAYPGARLEVGARAALPLGLPFDVHWLLMIWTDFVDRAFCAQYGWPRTEASPETLTPD